MTDKPSFDSFNAFRSAQNDYYRSLYDEPGYQGACARLALAMRFQLFEWLDGEMRRRTRPDHTLDALSTMLATSAAELTMSVRHTCARSVESPAPPLEFWAAMVMNRLQEEFDQIMSDPSGFVMEIKGGKPLRES